MVLVPWLLALGCSPKSGAPDDDDSSVGPGIPDHDGDDDGYDTPTDCDDANAAVYPNAVEHCDGVDEDCDGQIDDAAIDVTTHYRDADGDGFGLAGHTHALCEAPSGYVDNDDDCDDADPSVSFHSVWYADDDGDGYGGVEVGTGCDDVPGSVQQGDDCDDTRFETHPNADERCNERDDDCDGETDEPPTAAAIWYVDDDGDGYGDPAAPVYECEQPPNGVHDGWDCDDADPSVSPDATEYCDDTVDSDCSGRPSNGCVIEELGTSGWAWFGTYNFGKEAARAGDVDGDGYDDLVAGCHGFTSDDVPYDGGVAYIVYGNTSPASYDDVEAVAGARIVGDDPDDLLADQLQPAGDLNGDGYDDVEIGSASWDDEACEECGDARVFFGPLSGEYVQADADVQVPSFVPKGGIGDTSTTGDFDNDGHDDLVVGGTHATISGGGHTDNGALFFVAGPVSGEIDYTAADTTFEGDADSRSAAGVTSLKDADGDGLTDFAVGADGADSSAGAVYLYDGPLSGHMTPSDADVVYTASHAGDRLGYLCEWAGDMDGDGSLDIAMSALYADEGGREAGSVYVVYGPLDESIGMEDADAVLYGRDREYYFGISLAEGADLDGDGFDDLLVGDAYDDTAAQSAGAAFVFYGPLHGPRSGASADYILEGEGRTAYAGNAVDVLDFDGDGAADLLVAAELTDSRGATYVVSGTTF